MPRYQSGQKLAAGRYTVRRILSKGGMGTIYLATDHTTFDRPVIVKVMLDYFDTADPYAAQAAHQRFAEEARMLAHLQHPAIPQIYTYFQEGSHNCIVMEYINGRDLQQGLTSIDAITGQSVVGMPYSMVQVLRWGIVLCQVLDYMASRQPHPVIHHDIKPANLLVEQWSGEVHLVDFGTARARLSQQAVGRVGLQQSSIYGTQGYAPPEQYQGTSEPRSDVYALAATLYHLATDDDPGNHPFSFPQLSKLGGLGHVLRAALDPDVARRPTAPMLEQQLQTLLKQSDMLFLQTPDGNNIADISELVQWCEAHWESACAWLYSSLPEKISTLWGQNRLAGTLRTICQRHPAERDAALDAVLRILDPQFPAPQVTTIPAQLDCGTYTLFEPVLQQQLVVRNIGRGYAIITVHSAAWLVPQTDTVRLRPGQEMAITLEIDLDDQHDGGHMNAMLRLSVEGGSTLQVPVSATFVMQAPDGSQLTNISEVVAWCRRHWSKSSDSTVWKWLSKGYQNDTLSNQIKRWGHRQLSEDLTTLVQSKKSHTLADTMLDQALSLLDPHGYGSEKPFIEVDTTTLVFHLRKNTKKSIFRTFPTETKVLRITNRGHRFTQISCDLPFWIVNPYRLPGVGPEMMENISFDIVCANIPLERNISDYIRIFDCSDQVAEIAVRIEAPLWRKFWWRYVRGAWESLLQRSKSKITLALTWFRFGVPLILSALLILFGPNVSGAYRSILALLLLLLLFNLIIALREK
ncbi:MAG: serine/threonine-protein kinase [Chloroflexota bacterium]